VRHVSGAAVVRPENVRADVRTDARPRARVRTHIQARARTRPRLRGLDVLLQKGRPEQGLRVGRETARRALPCQERPSCVSGGGLSEGLRRLQRGLPRRQVVVQGRQSRKGLRVGFALHEPPSGPRRRRTLWLPGVPGGRADVPQDVRRALSRARKTGPTPPRILTLPPLPRPPFPPLPLARPALPRLPFPPLPFPTPSRRRAW